MGIPDCHPEQTIVLSVEMSWQFRWKFLKGTKKANIQLCVQRDIFVEIGQSNVFFINTSIREAMSSSLPASLPSSQFPSHHSYLLCWSTRCWKTRSVPWSFHIYKKISHAATLVNAPIMHHCLNHRGIVFDYQSTRRAIIE